MFDRLKDNIILEVIFKYIILLLLFICVIGLFMSGILFLNGEMSENSLNLHIFFGFSLVVLTIIHSYVKKKKLKKLSLEFKNILNNKPVQMDCNTTRFLNALNDVKVGELSKKFGSDIVEILRSNDIKVKSVNETMKQICKNNDEKMFYIFVLIVEAIFKDKEKN
ncbi:chemotaxis protein [Campylobacter concisus]|uniref:chemotaxis protein n=1 Tax=Campylobacter concisus TaxID=199 RepID=UPI000D30AD87|nr:chemotaxis protein [Campylobacter concisus]